MSLNPLLDKDFLSRLDSETGRETFVRIIALDFSEYPIEQIEGVATGGSINIDGASAVRRTCSLTMITKNVNINDFNWGLKSKFKLEIGVINNIDNRYPNIIWFPQGIYVITGFNVSSSISNCTISISGKDKMCLLNGDIGGNLVSTVDFGTEEIYDNKTQTTTYKKRLIKDIFRDSLHEYAGEPYHNIVLNDLDETAVELLEYRGDTPLYLFRDVDSQEFVNFTDNGDMTVTLKIGDDGKTEISLSEIEIYDNRFGDADIPTNPTEIIIKGVTYTVAKLEYGQTAGFRLTDLTYAGDLIAGAGESLTSVYDKIKNMLGNYEYFYDIDGRFIFQKKKNYIYNSWNGIVKANEEQYVESSAHSSALIYKFEGNKLLSSVQNSPVLNNLKNDYSIWGERESASGAKIPIHYRYAIDTKPKYYKAFSKQGETDQKEYTDELYDWREIIYQMAVDHMAHNQDDDYGSRLAANNVDKKLYQYGKTGYEQYYTDILGFWRQLYDINPQPQYKVKLTDNGNTYMANENEVLYIKGRYVKQNISSWDGVEDKSKIFMCHNVGDRYEMQPPINTIDLKKLLNDETLYFYKFAKFAEEDSQKPLYYLLTKDELDTLSRDLIYYSTQLDKYDPPVATAAEEDEESSDDVPPAGDENTTPAEEQLYEGAKPLSNYFDPSWKLNLYIFEDDGKYRDLNNIVFDSKDNNITITKDDNNKDVTNSIVFMYTEDKKIYQKLLYKSRVDGSGKARADDDVNTQKQSIVYYEQYYTHNTAEETNKFWSKDYLDHPENLNFWFDFLDAESELGHFSVRSIGDRQKVVNDNNIKAIYFKEVPNLIFEQPGEKIQSQPGYSVVKVVGNLADKFTISAQGKSAHEYMNELVYNYSYCIENISLSIIPIYYLTPNTRIFVRDENSKIDGEYIISKFTIPLAYNGLMSITATKAPERIM